jgi:hypothetical protein
VIHFRQASTFLASSLDYQGLPVAFEMNASNGRVAVTIYPPDDSDEQAKALAGSADVRAETSLRPPGVIQAGFEALAERRLPDDSPPRSEWPRDFDYVDADLRIEDNYVVPGSILSDAMMEFVRRVTKDLRDATETILSICRWRLALDGPHDPAQFGQAWWSLDGEVWEHLPGIYSVSISDRLVPRIDASRKEEIQALLDGGYSEPLAHALWFEASGQADSNPRSAVVIGISALEVGIKQFAAQRIPDAEWLLTEAPTAPVTRMLSEFLPRLPVPAGARKFSAPDPDVLAEVKKAVQIRNEITHAGRTAKINSDLVRRILKMVRRLLWEFDDASGLAWPRGHIERAQR